MVGQINKPQHDRTLELFDHAQIVKLLLHTEQEIMANFNIRVGVFLQIGRMHLFTCICFYTCLLSVFCSTRVKTEGQKCNCMSGVIAK